MTLPVEEVRLSLPHIELAAHIHGPEDGLPVLAVHGWMDNAMSFARLIPKLHELRIVAVDLAGHGYSDHRPPGAAYTIWDNVHDLLQVADQFGWERFSLLGHSMGAIVSTLLAGTMPQRVERLALIDAIVPPTAQPEDTPLELAKALEAQRALAGKRKRVHDSFEKAIEARMKGKVPVNREASELLAQRGVMPVPGGYIWRTDNRLTLPTPIRLTLPQALAFVHRITCPVSLVLASQGIMKKTPGAQELLKDLPIEITEIPGCHHLHLEDEEGAQAVADCFNRFFQAT
ncbi:alpha/beta fold hydrolase [Zestomonas carbonaria]|uniref:2-succinyl-6-hydroxy-2, 4-cyclohexadiene-1-carboxylate synthase n=1 Tax=Zestomonas carbonaria TaxID=2762745 RepID=A0A7U7ER32_9GAMM|nr:alpha/beta hydrolase [Pseudomonas carbonaria]CAD5109622.1 2-succinyl-6-hydroxy-2, 4-cyclohexadiene-1-carboxylate synthase [Pseudomonas carbonaria]